MYCKICSTLMIKGNCPKCAEIWGKKVKPSKKSKYVCGLSGQTVAVS